MTRARNLLPVLLAALLGLAGLLAGCGEKIAIPVADKPFSVNAYYAINTTPDSNIVQFTEAGGLLYVLDSDGNLSMRYLDLTKDAIMSVSGLMDATTLCADEADSLIFVWLSTDQRVSVYDAVDLSHLGDMDVSGVQSVSTMAANSTGVQTLGETPEPATFLYLSDPDSLVVHRFAFYPEMFSLEPKGILTRAGGSSTRFVHEPAGLLKDRDGMMLACDLDEARNWVIRFDPTPDLDDIATATDPMDPWRGETILISGTFCEPPAQADYTLGDAPECGETEWVGAPSAADGEFDMPIALDQDGEGVIYVLDRGNDRVQLFSPAGEYIMQFGDVDNMPDPAGLVVVDWRISSTKTNYGAYVFIFSLETGRIHMFISYDQFLYLNAEPPPDV